jgi:hypothetical protein
MPQSRRRKLHLAFGLRLAFKSGLFQPVRHFFRGLGVMPSRKRELIITPSST